MHLISNLIKTSILGANFHKTRQFWVKPHIFDAKTEPFILFWVNSFEYLEHISIQLIEKLTGKIVSCV